MDRRGSERKAAGKFRAAVWESDWGWLGAAAGEAGLLCLVLPRPTREEAWREVRLAVRGRLREEPLSLAPLAAATRAYLAGRAADFSFLTLDWRLVTPFQRQVLEATRAIPRGETRTYGQVAAAAGFPGAARAVGQALGANPWPLIIPCHRVVAAGGPGGFSGGGLAVKGRLLALEGVDLHKLRRGRRK